MENFKSRNFNLLLYPDDPNHMEALRYISSNFQYVGCLHDKDLDDNGALKKPHYHIILRFCENRWRSALANELGIAENYLQKTGRFSASAQYLLHAGCEDKHLYDRSELIGPLADTVCNLLDRKDENARVVAMLDLLETCGYLSPSQASRLFAVNGYFFDFRRMGNLGLRILDEHNVRCSNGDHK